MMKVILCPIDGSGHADKALSFAVDLAAKFGARLVLMHTMLRGDPKELRRFAEIEGLAKGLHSELKRVQTHDSVIDLSQPYDVEPISGQVLANIGEHLLLAAASEAKEQGVKQVTTLMTRGDPAKRIIEQAKKQEADCIVMGSRGLSDVKALFLGSVSHKVSNQAPCTCITVK